MAGATKVGMQKKNIKAGNDNFSGLVIRRANPSLYNVYTARGIQIGAFWVPEDYQRILDCKMLAVICNELALRWRVKQGELGKEVSCKELLYVQTGTSSYDIYVPVDGGIRVGTVLLPPDQRYVDDSITLSHIVKALAVRYGI